MISLIIFCFLSTLSLFFYPVYTLLAMCYSLIIVYIYNKCNIKNYKSMSCVFLKLLVLLFYLLDIKLIIAGVILLLLVLVCITNIFNNNILSMCDNNYIINILWKGNNFIISFLLYIYTPIYKYIDIKINKLINLLTSPKLIESKNKSIQSSNELEQLELMFKNINEQPMSIKQTINSVNLSKDGYSNKHKFKNNRTNIDKQTKELINMFEKLNSILQEQT
jgi:hypothetical protein